MGRRGEIRTVDVWENNGDLGALQLEARMDSCFVESYVWISDWRKRLSLVLCGVLMGDFLAAATGENTVLRCVRGRFCLKMCCGDRIFLNEPRSETTMLVPLREIVVERRRGES
jgi:hypothetical protein